MLTNLHEEILASQVASQASQLSKRESMVLKTGNSQRQLPTPPPLELPPPIPMQIDSHEEDDKKVTTVDGPPTWVTFIEKTRDETRQHIFMPGSKLCPLIFNHEKFTNVIFRIDEPYKHIKFQDCWFERSAVWGDLATVENHRPKYIQPEYCSMDLASIFTTPGSKNNPLIFHKITFAYLDFDMSGDVYAYFKECTFHCTQLIGFEKCTFERCTFTQGKGEYNKTPLAFYVKSLSIHAKTPVIYGSIEPCVSVATEKKRVSLKRVWKSFQQNIKL
jgi:hypothetical protein